MYKRQLCITIKHFLIILYYCYRFTFWIRKIKVYVCNRYSQEHAKLYTLTFVLFLYRTQYCTCIMGTLYIHKYNIYVAHTHETCAGIFYAFLEWLQLLHVCFVFTRLPKKRSVMFSGFMYVCLSVSLFHHNF